MLLMTNEIILQGVVVEDCVLNEKIKGELIYSTKLEVPRLSDRSDVLVIRISNRFTAFKDIKVGTKLRVVGSIRTRNVSVEGQEQRRLEVTVFCDSVEIMSDEDYKPENTVRLQGTFRKESFLRKAKTCDRSVCEQLICSERKYNKRSYVPTVFWGRTAEYAATLPQGTEVYCEGRLQSRKYIKRLKDGEDKDIERRVTYEFVASSVELMNDEAEGAET